MQENDVPEFIALISEIFPKTKDAVEYVKGIPVDDILLPEVSRYSPFHHLFYIYNDVVHVSF